MYFGRLSKEKGIFNLIEAFSKCKHGKLYIAGEGPEKTNIENFIKDNNLSKKVKLLGFLSKEQITEKIRKARFIVVPSIWYENCPYSVMETLAIGKPVIGADIAGIPELVINNKNGLTYKYDSVDELAEKMKELFIDDKKIVKFSKQAKELSKLYDKELYYKKIIKIYNNVIRDVK